jgi:hypothetical protein
MHGCYLDINKKYSLKYALAMQLGVCLINKKVTLYKRVKKISDGVYESCYSGDFIYEDGKEAVADNPEISDNSCASDMHLSTALYWEEGDTLIACEVKEEDIITIQEGKVRCKKCKVIGEVTF